MIAGFSKCDFRNLGKILSGHIFFTKNNNLFSRQICFKTFFFETKNTFSEKKCFFWNFWKSENIFQDFSEKFKNQKFEKSKFLIFEKSKFQNFKKSKISKKTIEILEFWIRFFKNFKNLQTFFSEKNLKMFFSKKNVLKTFLKKIKKIYVHSEFPQDSENHT